MPRLRSYLAVLTAAAACAAHAAAPTFDEARIRAELARMSRPESLSGFQPRSERGARGLQHILGGQALPLTMPRSAYRLLSGRQDPVEQWLAEGTIPSPFFQDSKVVLAVGDVVHEDAHGIPLVTRTCITCHAGPVAGRVVAGVANAQLDKVPGTRLAQSLDRFDLFRTMSPVAPPPELDVSRGQWLEYYRYLRDYKAYADEILVPSYKFATGRGDNTGAMGAWFMMARLADPEATGLILAPPGDPRNAADELLLATEALPTVDPNPWWNIKFKDRAYRFWDAPGHAPKDFNFNFYIPRKHIDREATLEAHDARVRARIGLVAEALHFARETEPPPLPPELAARLEAAPEQVAEGSRIFHRSCASCHGTYRREGEALVVSYPNRGPVDVGTDPAYNSLLRRLAPLADKLSRTAAHYGEEVAPHSYPLQRRGYPPPVLVGAWASAPYFHNGSVPTLRAVLAPADERPEIWGRDLDSPAAYDMDAVGLSHDEVTPAELAALNAAAQGKDARSPEAIARRRVYDTHQYGRSNRGHPFGGRLDPEQREAVLAFLASLAPYGDQVKIVPEERP